MAILLVSSSALVQEQITILMTLNSRSDLPCGTERGVDPLCLITRALVIIIKVDIFFTSPLWKLYLSCPQCVRERAEIFFLPPDQIVLPFSRTFSPIIIDCSARPPRPPPPLPRCTSPRPRTQPDRYRSSASSPASGESVKDKRMGKLTITAGSIYQVGKCILLTMILYYIEHITIVDRGGINKNGGRN